MSDETTHFVSYYSDPSVRRKIRKKRRERYQEDEDYRERQKTAARARYEPKGKRARGRNKPRVVEVDGELVLLVGLGPTADMLGVTKKTVRRYESQGVIPQNVVIDSLKRRWYPLRFVEFLVPFFAKQREKREPLWKLGARVEQAWAHEKNRGEIPLLEESQ